MYIMSRTNALRKLITHWPARQVDGRQMLLCLDSLGTAQRVPGVITALAARELSPGAETSPLAPGRARTTSDAGDFVPLRHSSASGQGALYRAVMCTAPNSRRLVSAFAGCPSTTPQIWDWILYGSDQNAI